MSKVFEVDVNQALIESGFAKNRDLKHLRKGRKSKGKITYTCIVCDAHKSVFPNKNKSVICPECGQEMIIERF